jgi:hypothetical protein
MLIGPYRHRAKECKTSTSDRVCFDINGIQAPNHVILQLLRAETVMSKVISI